MTWLRDAAVVARWRFRVQRRQITRPPRVRAAAAGLLAALSYVLVRPFGEGAFHYGRAFRSDPIVTTATLEATVTVVLVLVLLVFVFRAATNSTSLSSADQALVVATPTRPLVVGVVLAEAAFVATYGTLVAGIAGAAFAVGAGAPLVWVTVTVGVWLLFLAAAVVAWPVGFAVARLLDRRQLRRSTKLALGVAFLVVYEIGFANADAIAAVGRRTPLAWFDDVLFLGASTPGGSAPPLGALGLAAVGVSIGLSLAVPIARRDWFEADVPARSPSTEGSAELAGGLLDRYVGREEAAVARLTWRRTRRRPLILALSAFPLVGIGILWVQTALGSGPPVDVGLLVAVSGALAAGGGFTLNPIGYQGNAISTLLVSPLRPRSFLWGQYVAALPLVLLAVGLTVVTVAWTDGATVEAAATVWLSAVLAGVAPLISLAAGCVAPRYESLDVLKGRPTAIPGRTALALFVGCVVVTVGPGTAVLLLPGAGAAVLLAGVGTSTLLALRLGALGFGYARVRLRAYSID